MTLVICVVVSLRVYESQPSVDNWSSKLQRRGWLQWFEWIRRHESRWLDKKN
jgi:hypothetical protein